jgi:thiamine biosynthesis lipoprotein
MTGSAAERRGRVGAWLLATALLLAGPGRAAGSDILSADFMGMGTMGSLLLPAGSAARSADYLAQVTACIGGLEGRLSIFKPESDLARLNAAAGKEGIEVAPETLALLQSGLQASRDSEGAFDMTVGPLMALWGFRGSNTNLRLPTEAGKAEALAFVGADHVVVSGRTVRLDRAGVRLDAGGIGRGFAVDRVWEALRQTNAGAFLMNLGGNMRASGRPVPERPWTVGVRHPFKPGAIVGKVRLADGMAVATSGHYERFVTIRGVRYAHIMDPRTGEPVRGMAGVTVVTSTAAEADVLSTTLFVMGPEAGLAMLRRTGRQAEALFIPDRQPLEILATPGMAELFEPAPGMTVRILDPLKKRSEAAHE